MKSVFFCVDGHTAGNPVRLVAGGAPLLTGSSMSERRQDFLARFDWIRLGLMFEPRGHDMMSGGFLYPPFDPNNDAAILFMETSGCLPMCGHGTIGIITFAQVAALMEEGLRRRLGQLGSWAVHLANGEDVSLVVPDAPPMSTCVMRKGLGRLGELQKYVPSGSGWSVAFGVGSMRKSCSPARNVSPGCTSSPPRTRT